MKKITLFATITCLVIAFTGFAQKGGRNIYNWSLGARMEIIGNQDASSIVPGPSPLFGGAFKFLLDPQKNIEILALSDINTGLDIHGLFAIFNPFPEMPQNFRYFFGAGAHAGRWTQELINSTKKAYFDAGVDGQLGIEFIGRKIPLALSFDWHPVYNVVTKKDDTKAFLMRFGLTLKYTYKR